MVDPEPIPQTDPKAGYLARREQIEAAIARVLDSGWYVLGKEVAAFEREFADYLGVSQALGVASGTDALEISLRALGVGPGDAVLTVSHTAVATVSAIERCGASAVLVDVDDSYTMSPSALEDALRAAAGDQATIPGRHRAIVPVHLYGHPADMPAILEVAERYGLYVVEDCAQAHGASLEGRKCGTWGDLAAYSFYPTKNLGAIGDGGMIAGRDASLLARAREMRQYGWRERHVSAVPGVNSRLDEVQAAILRAKLPALEADNERRRRIADHYRERLQGGACILPPAAAQTCHVYHQFVVRTDRRDDFRSFLKREGIGTGIHYALPVHLQPAYRGRTTLGAGGLPCTEDVCRSIVSLPMYPQLSDADVERVCDRINSWTREKG